MNLELVTTKALLDELETRFKTMIFSGIMDIDGEYEKEVTRHSGHFRTSQGLCLNLALRLSAVPGTESMTDEDL